MLLPKYAAPKTVARFRGTQGSPDPAHSTATPSYSRPQVGGREPLRADPAMTSSRA